MTYNNYNPNINPYLTYQQYTPNNQNTQPGIIPVQNEMEARNYPVAPSNSVTFFDGNYLYVKSAPVSQFEKPQFDRYKLVKEDFEEIQENAPQETPEYALKSDINGIQADLKKINKEIKSLKEKGDK